MSRTRLHPPDGPRGTDSSLGPKTPLYPNKVYQVASPQLESSGNVRGTYHPSNLSWRKSTKETSNDLLSLSNRTL